MSEMDTAAPPEQGGGGNFFTQKYMGIPGIVWLGGAAILAYFLFFRKSSSSSGSGSGASNTGTGGTSGNVTFNQSPSSGFGSGNWSPVNTSEGSTASNPANNGLNPGQPQVSGAINPQPTPPVTSASATTATSTSTAATPASTSITYYTVQAGDTLASVAKKFGISVATLAAANTYVKGEVPGNKKVGQPLGTGAGLLTGQVLKIPKAS
jgi:LysM repeat protein